jgi:hypothetical protein
VATH